MKMIRAWTSQDSLSASIRQFQWRRRKEEDEEPLSVNTVSEGRGEAEQAEALQLPQAPPKKKTVTVPAMKLRSVLTVLGGRSRSHVGAAVGNNLIGTLFGSRRGHVHFAFQAAPKAAPLLLIELATPTCGLVREMATGLVRIALECDRAAAKAAVAAVRLVEEPVWRTYCNGKKCGFAVRRECGPADWKVLRAVEPISMGAGVLPRAADSPAEGELMYMRARFERVVGSRDSEAFYMLNPDSTCGPELSLYLLRV